MLWVDDVKTAIDYYVNVLGFNPGNHLDNWGWGCVVRDDVEFMFCKPFDGFGYTKPGFTGSLYINTDDVDGWWDLLKDKADILYPVGDFEYKMREFAIKDCNGYIIQFGQDIS
jgi:uncharacterized glyoxalase superfamily protein PhnB